MYQPVASSKWRASTIPVFIRYSNIRIFGDYKQTVRKTVDCDK